MNGIQSLPRSGLVRLAVGKKLARPPHEGPEADYRCVEISDDGEGITDAVRPHVFEPFFTTKRNGEGSGLGLSVSYRLAREHEGWIGVDTVAGQGSCFTLYLPPAGPSAPFGL